MGGKKTMGVNSKAAVGRAKKEESEMKKKEAEQAKLDAQKAVEWSKGTNTRRATKEEEDALKADEAARKRKEKADLLAAEEAELSGTKAKAKNNPTAMSKKKKQQGKKDDLALLEDALVKGADKSVRKKKEMAAQKAQQQQEERERAAAKRQDEAKKDPLLANTDAMIGSELLLDGTFAGSAEGTDVGRNANRARMEADGVSGLDGALETLDIKVGEAKSAKVLYTEFEERMLPQVKEDYPGLRLSQYKEKVFAMWKKSSDTPANQQQ